MLIILLNYGNEIMYNAFKNHKNKNCYRADTRSRVFGVQRLLYSFVSIISSDIACQSIIYPSPPKLLSLTHYIH